MSESDVQLDELTEAWGRIAGLFATRRDAFFAELAAHQLNPPHGHALMALGHGPARMGDLADNMACDASYVTGIADRLESLGLVVRRNAADDRRVRELVLTTAGEQLAQRLSTVFATPPAELVALPAGDRAELVRILRAVGDLPPGPWTPARALR